MSLSDSLFAVARKLKYDLREFSEAPGSDYAEIDLETIAAVIRVCEALGGLIGKPSPENISSCALSRPACIEELEVSKYLLFEAIGRLQIDRREGL